MYVSFVLVIFKFIRSSFTLGRILYIHLHEAPDVDRLMELLDQIYLARELKDFWLEEELYAKLIFILRCPEVLFYMTRLRTIVSLKSDVNKIPSEIELQPVLEVISPPQQRKMDVIHNYFTRMPFIPASLMESLGAEAKPKTD
ncbi:piezo-type mechanosensitive ion channel component [Biomphalaria glabrata]